MLQTKRALVITALIAAVAVMAVSTMKVQPVYAPGSCVKCGFTFAPGQLSKLGPDPAINFAPGQLAAVNGLPASQFAPGQQAKVTPVN